VCRTSVLVNRCLPCIGVVSNTLYFVLSRGVHITSYFSSMRGDTLPLNVGPREDNTSNCNFGPREEDTLQCERVAAKRMP